MHYLQLLSKQSKWKNVRIFMINYYIIWRLCRNLIWGSVLTWASPCDANFAVFFFFFPSPMFWAQTNCPFAWMFFFRTLATAFPTTYHMKTDCSCRVWKLSNDACPLKLVPSASFLTQRDKLEKKADQSLCIRKEALGMRLMTTRPW